jgi:hypothetical protein
MRMMGATAGLALAIFGAGEAAAADTASLFCFNSGNKYKVGAYACIAACHGQRRLARCDVIAEIASWTYVSNTCPSALLPPSPWDTNLTPVAVAMTPLPLPVEHIMSEMSPEAWMRYADLRKQVLAAGHPGAL